MSKMEISLMTAIGSASIGSPADRRSWNEAAKKTFDEFIALSHGFQKSPGSKRDEDLLKYYDQVIKPSAPRIRKTKKGLVVEGLPGLDDLPTSSAAKP